MKKVNPLATRLLIFLTNKRIPILSRALGVIFNSDIYCKLPKTTVIGHPYGIVIHSNTVLGDNVTIMHQVTIGSKSVHESNEPCIIGDNVFIGAGAKIIGGIKIGENVKIGANAIVTKDVSPNCTVINDNKILSKAGKPKNAV